jgi:DMSO/TMAO reductase YedYZ molybdopterin-dependent catalytic subunit
MITETQQHARLRAHGAGLLVHTTHPLNAETPIQALTDGLTDGLTSTEHFYVRNHFSIPDLNPADWRLAVSGFVRRRLTLDLVDLCKMRSCTQVVTLECAGNNRVAFHPQVPGHQWRLGAVGTAEWTGVPLVDVLDRAKLTSRAREVLFRGADRGHVDGRAEPIRFERSLSLDDIEACGALLAYEMNGAPLTLRHGYPLRLVVPGWYGVASVKWLTAIKILDHTFDGHFQTELYRYVWHRDGHTVTEPVRQLRVRAVITEPDCGQTLTCGALSIRGLAWSGLAPISDVRVRVGRRPWQSAHLLGQPQRHGWRGWELLVHVDEPGTTTVQARATDRAGRAQPDQPDWNQFGYGGNSVHTVSIHLARTMGAVGQHAKSAEETIHGQHQLA